MIALRWSGVKRLLVASCILLGIQPCYAEENAQQLITQATPTEAGTSYSDLTKKILLCAIDLERFSLNYRLEGCKQPLFEKLVFFGTQEAGAATGLAFEITGTKQFDRGRHTLGDFDSNSVSKGLRAAEVGSIIAASGCAVNLAASGYHYAKAHRKGLDTKSADRYVTTKMSEIDKLLSQRESLVAAESGNPAVYQRAVIEGKILHSMRSAFANEFSQFTANTRGFATVRNLFFLLNGSYNTVGAIAAGVANHSLRKPRLTGTSNVLFTISGAMAAAAPLICSAQFHAQRKHILNSHRKRLGVEDFDLAEMEKQCKLLAESTESEGTLMPSFPATQRFGLYSQSSSLFVKQLENEESTIHKLNKVALQNSLLGPAIGGLLMTQGILGTRGYYTYFPRHLKKQFDLNFKGSVCGTVGTSMAVVGNAAWCLASLSYEHRLRKQKRLPEQLINERLKHLEEVEQIVKGL